MFLLSVALLLAAIPAAAVLANSLSTDEKYSFLVKQGIFTGFDDGSSRLNVSMTREQFAAVLFRLWELKKENSTASYHDVLKTRWSFGEIQAVTKAGLMKGMGSDKFLPSSNVTVEQLAVVLVRAYGAAGSSSAAVYGSVSPWAKQDVGIAIKKGWIPEQTDYRANALRALLVQAAYAVFNDMNPDKNPERKKLDVIAVNAISNTVLQVDLRVSVNSVSADQFVLERENGKAVNIGRVSLSQDGKRVLITTDWQYDGGIYRLKVDGNTWVYKVSLSDTGKPFIISSSITADAKIELIFSEALNKSIAENKANYAFNKNLDIKSVTLAPDSKKVTITTGTQTVATVYTLTVKNIKDLAGNTMDPRSDLQFGSVVDKTIPGVTRLITGQNKIVLTFNEALDTGTAERKENYVLDGGLGNPWKALYNNNDNTVTLSTSDQTNGKKYTLTLNGIKDTSGNSIASATTLYFAGEGMNGTAPITLQRIDAVNENVLELGFNRSLAGIALSELKIELVSDNGASISMNGWQYASFAKQDDNLALRIQFRKSDNANPSLFRQGHVYAAKITGIPGLKTSNNDNSKSFAGIDETNPLPYVANAVSNNNTAVTVYFSEAVKNVSAASFRLTDEQGQVITLASDSLNDRNKIVTQVTLHLAAKLEAGKTYRLGGGESIADAPGWNGLLTVKDSKPYLVSFQGNGQENAAPRIKAVTVKDRYTFEIEFTEPVTGANEDVYTLYSETDRASVNLTKGSHAGYIISEDSQKVTIHLYPGAAGPLRADKTYTLTYLSGSGRINDLQGKHLDTSSGREEVKFNGVDRDNARPEISAIEGWPSVLFITLSEEVTGSLTNAFEIIANGKQVTSASAALQGNILTLRVNGLEAGAVATVKFSPLGVNALLDLNKQKPIAETIFITVH